MSKRNLITRQEFIALISGIKKQWEIDENCHNLIKKIYKDIEPGLGYYDSVAADECYKFLSQHFNDQSDWIGYWIYDLNFGKKFKKGMVKSEGNNISLKTITDLYKLLVDNYDKKA